MTQKHRSISLIVIHCSATRVTQDFTFEQLEACHLARGFKSIGYHYYITKDGVVYPGRPESEVGAHARHYNAHSIGICYEGGLDENDKPPIRALQPRIRLCIRFWKTSASPILMQRYWATAICRTFTKTVRRFDVKRWLKLVDFHI